MDSEEALKLLGPYSKWQLRTYFIYAFGFGVPLAWMWMSIVFIGEIRLYIDSTIKFKTCPLHERQFPCEYLPNHIFVYAPINYFTRVANA